MAHPTATTPGYLHGPYHVKGTLGASTTAELVSATDVLADETPILSRLQWVDGADTQIDVEDTDGTDLLPALDGLAKTIQCIDTPVRGTKDKGLQLRNLLATTVVYVAEYWIQKDN